MQVYKIDEFISKENPAPGTRFRLDILTEKEKAARTEQMVRHARNLKAKHGFSTHKLKGGVFPPDYELEVYRALADALPEDSLRFDPNGVWSTEQAIRFGQAIEDCRLFQHGKMTAILQ